MSRIPPTKPRPDIAAHPKRTGNELGSRHSGRAEEPRRCEAEKSTTAAATSWGGDVVSPGCEAGALRLGRLRTGAYGRRRGDSHPTSNLRGRRADFSLMKASILTK